MKAKRPCIKCLARVLHPFHDNGQVHTNYIAEFVRLNGGPAHEAQGG